MQLLNTIADLRAVRSTLTAQVGLVPTMGYLHAGHMSLVATARTENDVIIASIFVNPTQFAEGEDLDSYPRDLDRDFQMLSDAGVDYVFTPNPGIMYPPNFQTWVTVNEITKGREGEQRPAHFQGVTTIVNKLFNLTQPDTAYFGQKDAQQVAVIRRMVYDLNIPINIRVCPIVRESDGLALSSRNIYLSSDERRAARVLNQALQKVGAAYENGERHPDTLRQIVSDLITAEPLAKLDYVSLAEAKSLTEITKPTEKPLLLSVAAQVGKPRLLDNCLLPLSLNTTDGVTANLGAVH